MFNLGQIGSIYGLSSDAMQSTMLSNGLFGSQALNGVSNLYNLNMGLSTALDPISGSLSGLGGLQSIYSGGLTGGLTGLYGYSPYTAYSGMNGIGNGFLGLTSGLNNYQSGSLYNLGLRDNYGLGSLGYGYGGMNAYSNPGVQGVANYNPFYGNYSGLTPTQYDSSQSPVYAYDTLQSADYDFLGKTTNSSGKTQGTRNDAVVIDLNGDGMLDVTGRDSTNPEFDIDGDGKTEKTSWMQNGSRDGVLVMDMDGDGKITGKEIMNKNDTDGTQYAFDSGYEKASKYGDTDSNGKISGDELKSFSVWVDKNGDGSVDDGELKSMENLGITQINLDDGTLTRQKLLGYAYKSDSDGNVI